MNSIASLWRDCLNDKAFSIIGLEYDNDSVGKVGNKRIGYIDGLGSVGSHVVTSSFIGELIVGVIG